MKQRIFHLIILDESGSMSVIERQAVSGVNETIQTIISAGRNHPEEEHIVTLVTFNSEIHNLIYDNCLATEISQLKSKDFRPMGCTPLYDAMGKALSRLKKDVADSDVVLVTVITDGEENSSREFSGPAIKTLVEKLKGKGWVFTYIGANQDVESVAASVGIKNSLAFDATPEGTDDMFARESACLTRFLSRVRSDRDSPQLSNELNEDFFF